MELKPGSRWKSVVCDTEVVVVRPPKTEAVLECGGHPMIANTAVKPAGLSLMEGLDTGAAAGKRFSDDVTGLEILCTKAGAGTLTINGRAVGAVEAKKLPASD